jgi:uncharacterized protein (TIGR02453 family)
VAPAVDAIPARPETPPFVAAQRTPHFADADSSSFLPASGAGGPRAERAVTGGFAGFRPAATQFFRDLRANQEKAWFTEHREIYEREVKAPMGSLVEDLAAELGRRGLPLTGDATRGLFRIHRDVRFSRDKSPYKLHAGAVLTRDGRKSTPGLLYMHLDPLGSFSAAGFYHAEPPELARLRDAIAYGPDEFLALEARLAASGLVLSRDESLARLPRGYEQAPASVGWALRLRNFIVERPIAAKDLRSAALVGRLADFAAEAMPLLDWGWEALS